MSVLLLLPCLLSAVVVVAVAVAVVVVVVAVAVVVVVALLAISGISNISFFLQRQQQPRQQ